jgi:hypothetical protein
VIVMRNVVLVATLAVAAAAPAHAQMKWNDRGFANLSGLYQSGPGNSTQKGSFELYEEPGTFEGPWHLGGGGALDLSGGMRVWRNLAVGLGYSHFSSSGPVNVTARIPDFLVFDQLHEQAINAGDFHHSQNVVHVSAVWFWPVTDKIDVAVSAGPSIFRAKADYVTGVNVLPNTSTATGVSRASASESAVGGHIGVDATYLIRPRIGAGLLLRYAGASVDLRAVNSLDLGGMQAGVGVRVRF